MVAQALIVLVDVGSMATTYETALERLTLTRCLKASFAHFAEDRAGTLGQAEKAKSIACQRVAAAGAVSKEIGLNLEQRGDSGNGVLTRL